MTRERDLITHLAFDPTDEELPAGLRRFGRQLEALQSAMLAAQAPQPPPPLPAQPPPMGQAMLRAGARTPTFMLQALARLDDVGGDEELLDELRWEAKVLEDALGAVDFWWTLLEKGRAWRLPTPVLERFSTAHLVACGRAQGWAEARGWVDNAALPEEGEVRLRANKLSRKLRDAEWPPARKERRRLVSALARWARDTDEEARGLDMGELEAGLHELRRKVRWFSITATALDGAVTLDTEAEPPPGWERYLTPEVVNNPFNTLPPAQGEPIRIPAPLFYALSALIGELGVLKDRAQWTATVNEALLATNAAPGKGAGHWLGSHALSPAEACAKGAALATRTLVEDRLLQRIAEALEDQA